MGRQKQTAPLQRTPSSKLVDMQVDSPQAPKNKVNGSAKTSSNISTNTPATAAAAVEAVVESPGVMQLFICVAGIYAAL